MFKILLILVIMIAIFNLACNSNNPFESSANNKPEISEIIVDTQPVRTNINVFLTVIATDKDGDNLTYYWKCSGGTILSGGASDIPNYSPTTNPARWKTPSQAGQYTITCTVSDGKDTSSKSISVDVI